MRVECSSNKKWKQNQTTLFIDQGEACNLFKNNIPIIWNYISQNGHLSLLILKEDAEKKNKSVIQTSF